MIVVHELPLRVIVVLMPIILPWAILKVLNVSLLLIFKLLLIFSGPVANC